MQIPATPTPGDPTDGDATPRTEGREDRVPRGRRRCRGGGGAGAVTGKAAAEAAGGGECGRAAGRALKSPRDREDRTRERETSEIADSGTGLRQGKSRHRE